MVWNPTDSSCMRVARSYTRSNSEPRFWNNTYASLLPDTAVNAGVGHKILTVRDGEIGSMGDTILLCPASDISSVEMRVKMYHGDGSVYFVEST